MSEFKKCKYIYYIYIQEYYSAVKKNEILSFAMWMDIKRIMLSEVSHTKMYINCMIV